MLSHAYKAREIAQDTMCVIANTRKEDAIFRRRPGQTVLVDADTKERGCVLARWWTVSTKIPTTVEVLIIHCRVA